MATTDPDPKSQSQSISIPDLDIIDVSFGNIKHLPPYDAIPDDFKRSRGEAKKYCEFISDWFFKGRTPEDMKRLTAREGVDRSKALAAVKAILASWDPPHGHKEAGAAYLLHHWFELDSPEGR